MGRRYGHLTEEVRLQPYQLREAGVGLHAAYRDIWNGWTIGAGYAATGRCSRDGGVFGGA
jgi:hypothetical protein